MTILIEGSNSKNIINTYMKCNNIPLLWRKCLMETANERDYVYNHCNRPLNSFDRHCPERYLYKNTDGDDKRMLDDERKIMAPNGN